MYEQSAGSWGGGAPNVLRGHDRRGTNQRSAISMDQLHVRVFHDLQAAAKNLQLLPFMESVLFRFCVSEAQHLVVQ